MEPVDAGACPACGAPLLGKFLCPHCPAAPPKEGVLPEWSEEPPPRLWLRLPGIPPLENQSLQDVAEGGFVLMLTVLVGLGVYLCFLGEWFRAVAVITGAPVAALFGMVLALVGYVVLRGLWELLTGPSPEKEQRLRLELQEAAREAEVAPDERIRPANASSTAVAPGPQPAPATHKELGPLPAPPPDESWLVQRVFFVCVIGAALVFGLCWGPSLIGAALGAVVAGPPVGFVLAGLAVRWGRGTRKE